jgi:hypothetical protein
MARGRGEEEAQTAAEARVGARWRGGDAAMTGEVIAFPDDEVNATRRRFLSGGAAVMAAPIIPVAIPTSEGPTDPVILLIAEEYRWRSLACKARAKADKAWFALRSGPRSPPPPGLYDETDRLQKLADDLYGRIMVTPAETLAGILAKLEFAYVEDDDDPDPDQVIIGAVIADLRRWLGARS